MSAITETAEYTGTVYWSPSAWGFAAETVYTATITLAPKTGYTLSGVAADFFTVAGAAATNSAASGVVTAVFPATSRQAMTVYAAGYYYTDAGKVIACYWKDGTRRDLELPADVGSSYAYSIALGEDGSVYTAGQYYDGALKSTACYWKDGTRTDLPSDAKDSQAFAIALGEDGSVYIAGQYNMDTPNNYMACQWKDGIRSDLELPADEAVESSLVNAIALGEDGSVYAAGWYTNNLGIEIACYWKDGTRTDLPSGEGSLGSASASAIALGEDGSVYTAGYYEYYDYSRYELRACYWKDGERRDLPPLNRDNRSRAGAIALGEDGSVYTAGSDGHFYYSAWYWKDGTRTALDSGQACAIALGEDGSYTAGYHYDAADKMIACYWKDGTRIDFPAEAGDSQAYGIALAAAD